MRQFFAVLALLLPFTARAQPGPVPPNQIFKQPQTVTAPWTFSGGLRFSLPTTGSIGQSVCADSGGNLIAASGANCYAGGGPAAAGTLIGSTLASGVTASSLIALAGGTVGTAAYSGTGTTGATVPLNNGGFTQSGTANFTGAFQINGANVLSVATGANPAMFFGPGAGAAFTMSGGLWALGGGFNSLMSLTADSEDTGWGTLSCQYLTTGGFDTCLGLHTIGYETTASNITATGTDSHRNAVGASNTNSYGVSSGRNGSSQFSQYFGVGAGEGNSASIALGGSVTGGGGDHPCATFVATANPPFAGIPSTQVCYTTLNTDTLTTAAAGLASAISAANLGNSQGTSVGAHVSTIPGGPATIGLDFPGTTTTGWAVTVTSTGTGGVTLSIGAGFIGGLNAVIGDHSLEGLGAQVAQRIAALGADIAPWITTGEIGAVVGTGAFSHATSLQKFSGIGDSIGPTCATGFGVMLLSSGNLSVDCPAGSTDSYVNIENIITMTGTGVASTSVTQVAGNFNVIGAIESGGTPGVAAKTCVASGATLTIKNGLITATTGC